MNPKIHSIKNSIIKVNGEFAYHVNQTFELNENIKGIVLSANLDSAYLLATKEPKGLKPNQSVKPLSNSGNIDLYENYFGRIVSPFDGIIIPVDEKQKGLIGSSSVKGLDLDINDRKGLDEPLETGIMAIDTLIPIGKGQRELIIGDQQTGKTTIALNTIINQKESDLKVIYIAVGQKRSNVSAFYQTLAENNALKNTIILYANPDISAEIYMAPAIGMTYAEILATQGEDVLVIIDDLSNHANIYREISLLTNQPVGREAYPNDIFCQHAQLLERAGRLSKPKGGGTITCLPIVKTVDEDIATLIPSNVISITDGQIFTSVDKFNEGKLPAININYSVSRTGGSIQSKLIKKISKNLQKTYALYDKNKRFTEVSFDIPKEIKLIIDKGLIIEKLFIQKGHSGYSTTEMFVLAQLIEWNWLSYFKDYLDKLINPLYLFVSNDLSIGIVSQEILSGIKNKKIDENLKQKIGSFLNSFIKYENIKIKAIEDYKPLLKNEYLFYKNMREVDNG